MHPTQKPAGPAPQRLRDRLGITEVDPAAEITPADILRGAARYLQLHGWYQGANYADDTSPTPPACALGALGMAAYGQRFPHNAYMLPQYRHYNRAQDYLRDHLGLTGTHIDPFADGNEQAPADIAGWNDAPDTTPADVIDALNEAADDWDRRHPGGVR